ncbi:phosphatase PAP2 family protein [Methanopyrus sp.]
MHPHTPETLILQLCHGLLYPWTLYLTKTINIIPPLLLLWTYLHHRRTAYVLMAALLTSHATTTLLKLTLNEPRPSTLHLVTPLAPVDHPRWSLPSGHTAQAFALATAYHLQRRGHLSPLLWTWATLIGATRILLGVHWPHDVLAGALVGIGAALFTHRTSKLWTRLLATLDPLARKTTRTA